MASRVNILVSRTFYQVGVITLFASLVWTVVGIYSVTSKESSIEIDADILTPINPTLDQKVIEAMTSRIKIEEMIATTSATLELGGER